VGTPEDFTAEWAYTALSRTRETTAVHVVGERRDRAGRSEIAPDEPGRDEGETVDALRAAMARSEREDLALQQLDGAAVAHVLPDIPAPDELARPTAPAPVAAEAAADRLEQAQRHAGEPVAEALEIPPPPRALRRADPLLPIRAAVGPEPVAAVDVDRLRIELAGRDTEALHERVEALRPVVSGFPHDPAEARKQARQADDLAARRAAVDEAIEAAREEADSLGRLERRRRRDEFVRRIDRAQDTLAELDASAPSSTRTSRPNATRPRPG